MADLSFLQRFSLGWQSLLRSLSDADYAERLGSIDEAPPALAEPEAPKPAVAEPAPAPVPEVGPGPADGALQILNLLQREGRLVDFLQQEVSSFSDAQIGQAARVVHEGCRRTLKRYLEVEPVLEAAEGEPTIVKEGFDAEAIKLVGNVAGGAPFRGILKHRGWRAREIRLPETLGDHDFKILAPAEVEL
ncbi:MAG TPA: DUF2760 domain-containing protein [Polyangiaceae bacterium]